MRQARRAVRAPPPSFRRAAGAALVAMVGAALAGCGGRQALADPFAPEADRAIRIEVENLNFNEATLHALRDGARLRLGTVSGKGNAVYRLEWRQGRELRIEIDLLADGSCTTRPLHVYPGEIVRLQIQSRLDMDPDCLSGAT